MKMTTKMVEYFDSQNLSDFRINRTEEEHFTYVLKHIYQTINTKTRLEVSDYGHVVEMHDTFCVGDPMVR